MQLNPGLANQLSGITTVALTVPATINTNKVTVATVGTRVQFGSTSCVSVVVKSLSTNTGFIYIGNSTVSSTNGFQLLKGDSVSLDINNTNNIYIDSSVNGEGVTWLSIT